jgi:hypothetical protein
MKEGEEGEGRDEGRGAKGKKFRKFTNSFAVVGITSDLKCSVAYLISSL